MKEYLAALVRPELTPVRARNVAREYLQARILGALQRAGAMVPLAFHGGTALRFVYSSVRHSEDLDFALEQARSSYDFGGYVQAVQSMFSREGYAVRLRVSDKRPVHSAFVRFPGLPHELGLSPHRDEVLAVKIEVDTDPPAGAVLVTSVARRYETLQLHHHDKASLLAGKLHAVLKRPYVKGRDLYDLLWYVSDPDWPGPNLTLLNNALGQTGWEGGLLTDLNWRQAVRQRVRVLSWQEVEHDVRPFLEPSAPHHLLTRDNLLRALG